MTADKFDSSRWPAWKFWGRRYLETATIMVLIVIVFRLGVLGMVEGAVELANSGWTRVAIEKLHMGFCVLFAVVGVVVCVWTWDDYGVNLRRRELEASREKMRRLEAEYEAARKASGVTS